MTDGAWAGYKYFIFTGDGSKLSVKIRGGADGKMKVFTDRRAKAVCEITVRFVEMFTDFIGHLSIPAGTHPLYFVYEGTGELDFAAFCIQY